MNPLEEIFSNVMDLNEDPYFWRETPHPRKKYDRLPANAKSSAEPPVAVTKLDLDMSRISNRIIAMGMWWKLRTEKMSHRNNVEEVAMFLNARYML